MTDGRGEMCVVFIWSIGEGEIMKESVSLESNIWRLKSPFFLVV